MLEWKYKNMYLPKTFEYVEYMPGKAEFLWVEQN